MGDEDGGKQMPLMSVGGRVWMQHLDCPNRCLLVCCLHQLSAATAINRLLAAVETTWDIL